MTKAVAEGPVREVALQGAVDHVPGHDRPLPVRRQAHPHMARRVPRRRFEPDLVVQGIAVVHHQGLAGGDDRGHAFRPHRVRVGRWYSS